MLQVYYAYTNSELNRPLKTPAALLHPSASIYQGNDREKLLKEKDLRIFVAITEKF